MTKILAAVLAALASTTVAAATTGVQFGVHLTLRQADEQCTSGTIPRSGDAVVQVVCASGNFVRIDPGRGSAGSQTGASRYWLQRRDGLALAVPGTPQDDAEAAEGLGTVTEYRLVRNSTMDNLVELLISF
jgi:hypothetical protein